MQPSSNGPLLETGGSGHRDYYQVWPAQTVKMGKEHCPPATETVTGGLGRTHSIEKSVKIFINNATTAVTSA